MSAPWMKFYPRDWRGDQALRAVSVGARGLWIECLCIMHEAKPYGHLVLNGEPVEGGSLARMTGIPVDEVSALLAELRQAGVLSVTSKGVVFSRRMTKDHARAQKGRKAATKRWSQASGGVEQSEAPNRHPNRRPITQKPETRDQKKDASHPLYGFDEWYREYPHKVQRGAAERAWPKARSIASAEELRSGLARYVASRPADRHWQNPATWLNGKGWLDVPGAMPQQRAGPAPAPPPKSNPALDAANALMEKLDAVSPSQTQGNQPYPRLVAFSGSG